MYIDNIKIQNFKVLKNTTFYFNEHFNLIIGSNNSGKSTMMEALRLWQLAFSKFLKDRTNNKESSFRANTYFSFTIDDIEFLRVQTFRSLFYNGDVSKKIIISVTLAENNNKVELPITFALTTEALNLRFELCSQDGSRLQASDDLLKLVNKKKGASLKNTLLISYIAPLFNLPTKELLYSKGYITQLIQESKSNEVIRNILTNLAPLDYVNKVNQKPTKELLQIEQELQYILYKSNALEPELSFTSAFKKESDIYLKILSYSKSKNYKVELSQLGSGTLNLINILSVLAYGDYEKFDLSVLLLDEPDSHLHADFQKRLFEVLIKKAKDKNKQMFVITHNHELIDASDEVLYVNSQSSSIKSISKESYYLIYKDIAHDYYERMLDLTKTKNVLDKLKKQNTKRNIPLIVTEGKTDWKHFKHALKVFKENGYFKQLNIEFLEYESDIEMGWSTLSTMLSNLSYIQQQQIIIGIFDSDEKKAINFVNNFVPKNNVYAIIISDILEYNPNGDISVEMLYKRDDILKYNINNRRLYFNDEFKKAYPYKHKALENIYCKDSNRINNNSIEIIADKVIDDSENSLALSKENFATSILNGNTIFDDYEKLEGFKHIFQQIQDIISPKADNEV